LILFSYKFFGIENVFFQLCTVIFSSFYFIVMPTKFPTFSQALAQDPTTRRLWFGIATAHEF
jgi:hypothetical protein